MEKILTFAHTQTEPWIYGARIKQSKNCNSFRGIFLVCVCFISFCYVCLYGSGRLQKHTQFSSDTFFSNIRKICKYNCAFDSSTNELAENEYLLVRLRRCVWNDFLIVHSDSNCYECCHNYLFAAQFRRNSSNGIGGNGSNHNQINRMSWKKGKNPIFAAKNCDKKNRSRTKRKIGLTIELIKLFVTFPQSCHAIQMIDKWKPMNWHLICSFACTFRSLVWFIGFCAVVALSLYKRARKPHLHGNE